MGPGSPGSTDALKQLYATLQRYAGWLDRERTSVMIRADVQALGAAIETRADPSPLLQSLDTNIARYPAGNSERCCALPRVRCVTRSPRRDDDD